MIVEIGGGVVTVTKIKLLLMHMMAMRGKRFNEMVIYLLVKCVIVD